jgi:hypothetical protein
LAILIHMNQTEIVQLEEMLPKLSKKGVGEVRDFAGFLLEKEKKHKAFVKRVLKAQKGPGVEFNSVSALMKAIQEFTE